MLPVNFHKTFIPERRFIANLLDYTVLGKKGTLKEISMETGIPMGEFSGKVPAMIDYARGMGLITLRNKKGSSIKEPMITSFGKAVYLEDKYLGEKMVQWLAHMYLCRNDMGAKTWHAVFAQARNILGVSFTKSQLEDYLISVCGPGNDRTGPMVLAYTEDAALARAEVLFDSGGELLRGKAPILPEYAIAYSAYLLSLMEDFFPGQNQVTLTDLNRMTYWFNICLWGMSDLEQVFKLIQSKGYISIDRQMTPWIAEKYALAENVWPLIWDDMA